MTCVMKDNVTGPLITRHGLEGFIPVVKRIETMLDGPRHLGLRELELRLKHDGKVNITAAVRERWTDQQ